MKKPDNIIYDDQLNEYSAYKKNYPTSFNSKNFELVREWLYQIEKKPSPPY